MPGAGCMQCVLWEEEMLQPVSNRYSHHSLGGTLQRAAGMRLCSSLGCNKHPLTYPEGPEIRLMYIGDRQLALVQSHADAHAGCPTRSACGTIRLPVCRMEVHALVTPPLVFSHPSVKLVMQLPATSASLRSQSLVLEGWHSNQL